MRWPSFILARSWKAGEESRGARCLPGIPKPLQELHTSPATDCRGPRRLEWPTRTVVPDPEKLLRVGSIVTHLISSRGRKMGRVRVHDEPDFAGWPKSRGLETWVSLRLSVFIGHSLENCAHAARPHGQTAAGSESLIGSSEHPRKQINRNLKCPIPRFPGAPRPQEA
jgi:hypothetical protein